MEEHETYAAISPSKAVCKQIGYVQHLVSIDTSGSVDRHSLLYLQNQQWKQTLEKLDVRLPVKHISKILKK